VAAARFELYARPRRTPGASGTPVPLVITWRLLSGNNRDLGRAAAPYPDAASCLAAVRDLQHSLAASVASVASPDGRARWTWRISVDARDVAVSSRQYQRRVQAEAACASFVALAAEASVTEAVRLLT
jgi:hypothetical protein